MSLDREILGFVKEKGGDYNSQLDKLEKGLELALRSVSVQSRTDAGVHYFINVKNSHGGTSEDAQFYLSVLKKWGYVDLTVVKKASLELNYYSLNESASNPDPFLFGTLRRLKMAVEKVREHMQKSELVLT